MIHQYKLSGYNIVLDVYSGSVHAVDDVAYDAIALIDQGLTREAATAQLEQKYRDRADVTPAVRLQEPLQRRQGAVPACGPHLQPELQLLLRRPGQVPR